MGPGVGCMLSEGTVSPNFEDTESSLASIGFLVVVSHGVNVVNGATSTIMKKGVVGKASANALLLVEPLNFPASLCP